MTSTLLWPTAEDVRKLDDAQLRDLVERLCRAELSVSTFGQDRLTAGGNQNAPDGGVDVRVEWESGPTKLGFLRHSPCLIQVKAEVMSRAKILAEMAPDRRLRPALIEAARRSGSYFIASGQDDCSDSTLGVRKAAMEEALDRAGCAGLVTDFRDASQLAAWAGQHPGVASWLMAIVGRPTTGWRAWGAWSTSEEDETAPYLVDEQARAAFGGADAALITIPEAITAMRAALRPARSVVRLVGLSGMGKTRLAQALFDPAVGEAALEKQLAVYGDAGEAPEVSPLAFAERVAAERNHGVLVVDNCPADLHRALTRAVRQESSELSLLTLDYDVGLDQPEGTTVVRLERAGDNLIEALLSRRFPALGAMDRIRAAKFSEGNARIALVIGRSAGAAGSLAALDDQQLLDRLFLTGRRPPHPKLRSVARAASLVYAFDIEAAGEAAEIPTFLNATGTTEGEFLEALYDLLDRGMAQKRGSQVAVLPQALAARLAREALQVHPATRLMNLYVGDARQRLFVSFTRRLSLLHDSPEAVAIARQLLARGGRLSDLGTMNDRELDAFANSAPLAPNEVLAAIEAALAGERAPRLLELFSHARQVIQRLAYQLAYERPLFHRAARLLGRLVLSEPEGHNRDSAEPLFNMLFGLAHSGTMAPPSERFVLIEELFASGDAGEERLGRSALKSALGGGSNGYGGVWNFGARSRGEGWIPQTRAEIDGWGASVLSLAVRLSRTSAERQELIRELVAETFWRLCIWMGCVASACQAVTDLAGDAFWPEGWVAVCNVLDSESEDSGPLTQDDLETLRRRQEAMAPRTAEHRFQAWAEGRAEGWVDPDQTDMQASLGAPFQFAQELGEAIGSDFSQWPIYLPRTVLYTPKSRLWQFGLGLAANATNVEVLWRELVRLFKATAPNDRSSDVLCGVVRGAALRDPGRPDSWLSAALLDEDLAPDIVRLQAAAGPLDHHGATRLAEAARRANVPISSFHWLQYSRTTEKLEPGDLDALLRTVADREGGPGQAADILSMRFHLSNNQPEHQLDPLLATGRHILRQFPFSVGSQTMRRHHLGQLAQRCLAGPEAAEDSRAVLVRLIEAFKTTNAWLNQYSDILGVIVAAHPRIALDEIFGSDLNALEDFRVSHALNVMKAGAGRRSSVLSAVGDQDLVRWMEEEPVSRAPKLAEHADCFMRSEAGELAWTPLALKLMEQDSVLDRVFGALERRFHSGMETGSFADRFARIRRAVEPLQNHPRPRVRAWATDLLPRLDEWIARYAEHDRDEFTRFE